MCTSVPVSTPSAEATPARRPSATLRVGMDTTFGPGMRTRASAATENRARVCGATMAVTLEIHGAGRTGPKAHRPGDQSAGGGSAAGAVQAVQDEPGEGVDGLLVAQPAAQARA